MGLIKKFIDLTNWKPKYSSKENFKKALIRDYISGSLIPKNLKNYKNINKYNI